MATVVVMLSKLLTHGTLLSRSFGKGLNHSNKLVMKPLECLHRAKSNNGKEGRKDAIFARKIKTYQT